MVAVFIVFSLFSIRCFVFVLEKELEHSTCQLSHHWLSRSCRLPPLHMRYLDETIRRLEHAMRDSRRSSRSCSVRLSDRKFDTQHRPSSDEHACVAVRVSQ